MIAQNATQQAAFFIVPSWTVIPILIICIMVGRSPALPRGAAQPRLHQQARRASSYSPGQGRPSLRPRQRGWDRKPLCSGGCGERRQKSAKGYMY